MPAFRFRSRRCPSDVTTSIKGGSCWLRQFVCGLSLVLVLTMADLQLPQSVAAAAEGVVASTPIQCPNEQPDEMSALVTARSCKQRVEVTELLSETTRVWALPDGTFEADVHLGPVRVRDQLGTWRDVDLSLRQLADGSVASKVHPKGLRLSGAVDPGGHELVVLGEGEERIALEWDGALPQPVLTGTKATYSDVRPGVDLVIEVTRTGFEQFFVVKDRSAIGQVTSLPLRVQSPSLDLIEDGTGGLEFGARSGGAVVGRVAAPVMWDAQVDERSLEHVRRAPVGLTSKNTGVGLADLMLTPDRAWLTDAATQYPVTIDPSFDINVGFDTWVQTSYSSDQSASTELRLGTYNGGGDVARSFLHIPATNFSNKRVLNAWLYLWEWYSWSCVTRSWELWWTGNASTSTRWNNQPAWVQPFSTSTETKGYSSSCNDGWVKINARQFFYPGGDGSWGGVAVGLKAANETDNLAWKKFNSANAGANIPHVVIEYTLDPNTPTNVKPTGDCYPSCTSGSTVRVTTPTLQATVSDPDGDGLTVELEIANEAKTAVVASTTRTYVLSGSTVTWTTPALSNGATYHYRARTQDMWGFWSSWSSYFTFTVNTAGPSTPSGVGVSGTGDCYLSCASPAMLRTLRPTFKAAVAHPYGDVLSVAFEVWNAATTSVVASTTVTNVAAGTTPTWQPSSNLPQQSQMHLRVRSQDVYGRWSGWSGWYTFTVDTQPPAAPSVSSPLYLHKDTGTWNGGVGVPGSFTFGPAADAVKYEWRFNGSSVSSVNVSAGAAHTLNLTPPGDLEQLLEVRSIDQAGWASAWVAYPFLVRTQSVDVAYWKFDETSGTTAAPATGGSRYNGVRLGGSTWAASGINQSNPTASGNAVSLDGVDDYVEMPRVLATNHAAGFSVSAWVKPAVGSLTTYRTVAVQQGTNTYAFRLYYKPESARWCFSVRDVDDTAAATYVVCSLLPPQEGVWTHLIGVYDRSAGKIRLYVNGGPLNLQPVPGTADESGAPAAWSATGSFRVGRSYSDEYWVGLIDEVRAYQRALPEVEARQMFLDCWEGDCPQVPAPDDPVKECLSTSSPMCVGEWNFDAGSGTTAVDSSGLGGDATLVGSAAWTSDGYDNSPAISLDGVSGYLETPGPVVLTDQSFTVSAWVKADQLTTDVYLVQQTGTAASAMVLKFNAVTSSWSFAATCHDGVTHRWNSATSTRPAQAGVWTHLVGIYDASAREVRLYVNGRIEAMTSDACVQASLSPLLIGGQPWGAVLDGTIDLVRVYQGALSTAQVAALYAEQVAPPQLWGWWELEEWDTQAYDYSENGNHGILSAQGAQWTADGHNGSSAVTFDGVSGSIETAGPVLRTTDSFSVSAWVRLADNAKWHSIVSQDGTKMAAFRLEYAETGQWCFLMRHADEVGALHDWVCGGSPQVGAWTHLVGVYDGAAGELRLYVNGTRVSTTLYRGTTWQAAGSMTIGRTLYTSTDGTVFRDFFAGTIDAVRAYQGALSDAQVTAVFNGLGLQ